MAIKFEANQLIREEHFLVTKKELKKTSKGDDYYQLELSKPEGKINAKIWPNNLTQCQVEIGKVVEANGKIDDYKGQISLIIDSCQIVESDEASEFVATLKTMVFDIETLGKDFEELDETEQEYLMHLEKSAENKEDAKRKTAVHPIFGKVCAIGMYDLNNKKGIVLSLSEKEIVPENNEFVYKTFADEKSLLEEFWKIFQKYEQFVTYNGDGFDFPFLIIRSGINRIKTAFEMKKWGSDKSIDLANKIRQNGRCYKLEFLCRAFGIKNPKGEGVHGDQVSDLFNVAEFNKIADYVARDVVATSELYLIWKEFMSGEI